MASAAGVYKDRIYETAVVRITLFVLFGLLFAFSYFFGVSTILFPTLPKHNLQFTPLVVNSLMSLFV